MTSMMSKTMRLYIVKFRPAKCDPVRSLTAFDRLAGWWDSDGDQPLMVWQTKQGVTSQHCVVATEGHERCSLRSRRAPHVATWEPEPGDEIVAVVPVVFERPMGAEWLSARYHKLVRAQSPGREHYRIECLSVLGREVALGEDGTEGAFGQDVLRECVECAMRNDWRAQLCDCQLTPLGDAPYPDPTGLISPLQDQMDVSAWPTVGADDDGNG